MATEVEQIQRILQEVDQVLYSHNKQNIAPLQSIQLTQTHDNQEKYHRNNQQQNKDSDNPINCQHSNNLCSETSNEAMENKENFPQSAVKQQYKPQEGTSSQNNDDNQGTHTSGHESGSFTVYGTINSQNSTQKYNQIPMETSISFHKLQQMSNQYRQQPVGTLVSPSSSNSSGKAMHYLQSALSSLQQKQSQVKPTLNSVKSFRQGQSTKQQRPGRGSPARHVRVSPRQHTKQIRNKKSDQQAKRKQGKSRLSTMNFEKSRNGNYADYTQIGSSLSTEQQDGQSRTQQQTDPGVYTNKTEKFQIQSLNCNGGIDQTYRSLQTSPLLEQLQNQLNYQYIPKDTTSNQQDSLQKVNCNYNESNMFLPTQDNHHGLQLDWQAQHDTQLQSSTTPFNTPFPIPYQNSKQNPAFKGIQQNINDQKNKQSFFIAKRNQENIQQQQSTYGLPIGSLGPAGAAFHASIMKEKDKTSHKVQSNPGMSSHIVEQFGRDGLAIGTSTCFDKYVSAANEPVQFTSRIEDLYKKLDNQKQNLINADVAINISPQERHTEMQVNNSVGNASRLSENESVKINQTVYDNKGSLDNVGSGKDICFQTKSSNVSQNENKAGSRSTTNIKNNPQQKDDKFKECNILNIFQLACNDLNSNEGVCKVQYPSKKDVLHSQTHAQNLKKQSDKQNIMPNNQQNNGQQLSSRKIQSEGESIQYNDTKLQQCQLNIGAYQSGSFELNSDDTVTSNAYQSEFIAQADISLETLSAQLANDKLVEQLVESRKREKALSAERDRLIAELKLARDETTRGRDTQAQLEAAGRAQREAVSDMAQQNARLVAAYLEQKQASNSLKELHQQQVSELSAQIQQLEKNMSEKNDYIQQFASYKTGSVKAEDVFSSQIDLKGLNKIFRSSTGIERDEDSRQNKKIQQEQSVPLFNEMKNDKSKLERHLWTTGDIYSTTDGHKRQNENVTSQPFKAKYQFQKNKNKPFTNKFSLSQDEAQTSRHTADRLQTVNSQSTDGNQRETQDQNKENQTLDYKSQQDCLPIHIKNDSKRGPPSKESEKKQSAEKHKPQYHYLSNEKLQNIKQATEILQTQITKEYKEIFSASNNEGQANTTSQSKPPGKRATDNADNRAPIKQPSTQQTAKMSYQSKEIKPLSSKITVQQHNSVNNSNSSINGFNIQKNSPTQTNKQGQSATSTKQPQKVRISLNNSSLKSAYSGASVSQTRGTDTFASYPDCDQENNEATSADPETRMKHTVAYFLKKYRDMAQQPWTSSHPSASQNGEHNLAHNEQACEANPVPSPNSTDQETPPQHSQLNTKHRRSDPTGCSSTVNRNLGEDVGPPGATHAANHDATVHPYTTPQAQSHTKDYTRISRTPTYPPQDTPPSARTTLKFSTTPTNTTTYNRTNHTPNHLFTNSSVKCKQQTLSQVTSTPPMDPPPSKLSSPQTSSTTRLLAKLNIPAWMTQTGTTFSDQPGQYDGETTPRTLSSCTTYSTDSSSSSSCASMLNTRRGMHVHGNAGHNLDSSTSSPDILSNDRHMQWASASNVASAERAARDGNGVEGCQRERGRGAGGILGGQWAGRGAGGSGVGGYSFERHGLGVNSNCSSQCGVNGVVDDCDGCSDVGLQDWREGQNGPTGTRVPGPRETRVPGTGCYGEDSISSCGSSLSSCGTNIHAPEFYYDSRAGVQQGTGQRKSGQYQASMRGRASSMDGGEAQHNQFGCSEGQRGGDGVRGLWEAERGECVDGDVCYDGQQAVRQEESFINDQTDKRNVDDTVQNKIEKLKELGNSAFQKGEYSQAADKYIEALQVANETQGSDAAGDNAHICTVLHCNTAAAFNKCGRYIEALMHVGIAEQLEPGFYRIYQRRSDAYEALGDLESAAQDLVKVGEMQQRTSVLLPQIADLQLRSAAMGGTSRKVNPYHVLGVQQGASTNQIKSAYKQLALKLHPDKATKGVKQKACEEVFKMVTEAYSQLNDPVKRSEWDAPVPRWQHNAWSAKRDSYSGNMAYSGVRMPRYRSSWPWF